jgi:hypothetical protein
VISCVNFAWQRGQYRQDTRTWNWEEFANRISAPVCPDPSKDPLRDRLFLSRDLLYRSPRFRFSTVFAEAGSSRLNSALKRHPCLDLPAAGPLFRPSLCPL